MLPEQHLWIIRRVNSLRTVHTIGTTRQIVACLHELSMWYTLLSYVAPANALKDRSTVVPSCTGLPLPRAFATLPYGYTR